MLVRTFLEERKSFVYIALVIYWLLLLGATSLPADQVPDVRTGDKLNHFLAYLGLAALLNTALLLQDRFTLLKKNNNLFTFGMTALYGALDEVHQYFIPGRSCEFLDWVADVSGATVGITIIFILSRKAFFIHQELK
jgi:VanZ family protein